jgi:hypothetical protein
MSELAFKRWFVEAWDGWLVRIEPGRGGDVGVSDLMVPVDGRLIPVELKVFVGGQMSEVRPSQKVWHRQAAKEGLVTLLAVGEKERGGGWRAFVGLGLGVVEGVWCDRDSLRSSVECLVRAK